MANVIAGQQHQQTVAPHQQIMATGASQQTIGQAPQAAFYAAYQQHPYQATIQQSQQQQAAHQQQHYQQQQAQGQLMLNQANAAYRPVVMAANQKAIVVQDPATGYQQQLAAFSQQQSQGFVLAYQNHQQQTATASTSTEQQR